MYSSSQLFGISPSGQKVPLKVDANGNLIVVLVST